MNALILGEILWDIFSDKAYIGGAPFNMAAHLSKMGTQSYLISSVGSDFLGNKARESVNKLNISDIYISNNEYPTGTVDVILGVNGIPAYTINENVAWDNIYLSNEQKEQIKTIEWDVICFGSLAQRTKNNQELIKFIIENVSSKEVFFDVNLRQSFFKLENIRYSISQSTIIKLNDEEARYLNKAMFKMSDTFESFAERIFNNYSKIKIICITKGPDGAEIYSKKERFLIQGIVVDVADTVGAGDSFGAGFLVSYLSDNAINEAGKFAVMLSSFVASASGAVPEYNCNIKKEISKFRCHVPNIS